MIKLTANKAKVEADIVGDSKLILGEAIAITIYLTHLTAQICDMSFDAASIFLQQQSALAAEQVRAELEEMQGGAEDGD